MNPSRHRKDSSSSGLWERWESVGLRLLDGSEIEVTMQSRIGGMAACIEGEELRVSQAAAQNPWDIELNPFLLSLPQGRCISSNRMLLPTTLSDTLIPLLPAMSDRTATP
jgi:hypothetical protein